MSGSRGWLQVAIARLRREPPCRHIDEVPDPPPRTVGCETCLETGMRWVHLRKCLTCGRVGCCNESPGRHATAHYAEIGHPMMRSMEPEETWQWCYIDEVEL
jgi:uncharacterized UBP type Zn finger protein